MSDLFTTNFIFWTQNKLVGKNAPTVIYFMMYLWGPGHSGGISLWPTNSH